MRANYPISGIILAGGKSVRMGEDKGLITWQGKTFTERIMDVLKELTNDILIVSNNSAYEKFGKPVFKDLIKDKGPLGGIYSGLYHSTTPHNIVVSCDTPFINSVLLRSLIASAEGVDVCILSCRKKWEPLIGYYHKNCLTPFLTSLQKEELKMSDAIEQVKHHVIAVEEEHTEDLLRNINSKEDLNLLS